MIFAMKSASIPDAHAPAHKHAPPILVPRAIACLSGTEVIGDGLMKLPFLQALRATWPAADIHWVTSRGPTVYASTLSTLVKPLITAVHETPAWLPSRHNPQADVQAAPTFDMIIDTRGRWRDELQARRLRPKMFVGQSWRYFFSDAKPALFQPRPAHIADRLLEMIEVTVRRPLIIQPQPLPLPAALCARAEELLPAGKMYVGLAPGAGNAIKCWPLENFMALARHVVTVGKIPVFILGPAEESWKNDLHTAVPQAILPLQENWPQKPDIFTTMAVGQRLSVAVVNDSGTSHMLVAINCPLISLFGPTRAAKLAPRVTRSHVLRAQDYGDDQMRAIPVGDVVRAVEGMLR